MCDCEECQRKEHALTERDYKKSLEREIPTLNLAALGLYPTHRMTIVAIKSTMTVTAAAGSLAVPQALAEVGIVDITSEIINPVNLHKLPGIPINGYPMVKDVSIIARVTAGTLVTPFELVGFLKFRDNGFREHIIGSLGMSSPTALAPTDSTLRAQQVSFPCIVISASPIGENAPKVFGSWVIEGALTLGTATTIQFDVFANIGVLYGVPK